MHTIYFLLIYLLVSGFLLADEECQDEPSSDCLVLTLETALSRALNNNRQLISSADGLTKSQYALELAFGEFNVQIVPNSRAGYVGGGTAGTGFSIGGGVDFSKKFPWGTTVSVGPSILKTRDQYHTDLRLMISQPLLRGFGKDYQLSGIKGVEFSLRTAQRNLYITQMQVVVRTITALYEIIKAQKALGVQQESYDRISKFYQAAKLKEKIGLSDALDVYRAEVELHHAEDALTGAQEKLQDTEDALRDLLALPLDTCIQIEVPLVYTPNPLELEDAIDLALKNRIEIDQSEDQWRESYRLSTLAKKKLYPDLNLVVNYSNCGKDQYFTRACTCHRESTWGIGFTTSSDFDPMGDRVAYEQSLMAIEASARSLEQTRSTLTLEVKKAMRQLQRALKRIQVQEEQMHTTQGELHLAQIKFDRGMANNFDVIQAEKSLRSAQQTYWSALIEHIVGEYQLLAALGLLTDKPCIP